LYSKECDYLLSIFNKKDINGFLNKVWQVEDKLNMVVIPMPLEARRSGVGPGIVNTAYQIVGPPFDEYILGNLIHEACHPRAKKVLEPLKKEIENAKYLFEIAKDHENWPEQYNSWEICFEEHLIRAVQAVYINPHFNFGNMEENLDFQKNRKGMVFIEDMREVLDKHENKDHDMENVVLDVLETLKSRYK
jgi:hypothetical protein